MNPGDGVRAGRCRRWLAVVLYCGLDHHNEIRYFIRIKEDSSLDNHVGFVGFMAKRGEVVEGSELFGKAFEHFMVMEVFAHAAYSERFYPITYWRTTSQQKVDLILGDGEVAIEIKSTDRAADHHLRGLRSLLQEHKPAHAVLVSRDPNPRKTADGIQILPWSVFLDRLWGNELLK
jgi:hypothetical protein